MSASCWEWGYNSGVKIEGDHILWYSLPTVYDREGGASEQKFEHFLANGPWYDEVPPEIVEKLTAAVRVRVQPSRAGGRKEIFPAGDGGDQAKNTPRLVNAMPVNHPIARES